MAYKKESSINKIGYRKLLIYLLHFDGFDQVQPIATPASTNKIPVEATYNSVQNDI